MSRRRKPGILALPSNVKMSDIDFQPTWQEVEWERWQRAKVEYERDIQAESIKELALLAVIIEQDKREQALEEFHLKREKFYLDQQAEDARQIAAYMAAMQTALDKPALDKLKARLARVASEIASTDRYIERETLKARGVYRGR